MLKFLLFGLVLLNFTDLIISQSEKHSNILSENVYSSLLARRREEHQLLIQHIKKTDDYEKKYKLLKIALEKILSIIDESKEKLLTTTKYSPIKDGFPKTTELFEIIGPIIENICLFGDLLLQIPKFSIKILGRQKNWRTQIEWSLQYLDPLFEMVAESKTLKMLTKLKVAINQTDAEILAENSVDRTTTTSTTQKSKQKKKIHKGPGLAAAGTSNKNEL